MSVCVCFLAHLKALQQHTTTATSWQQDQVSWVPQTTTNITRTESNMINSSNLADDDDDDGDDDDDDDDDDEDR